MVVEGACRNRQFKLVGLNFKARLWSESILIQNIRLITIPKGAEHMTQQELVHVHQNNALPCLEVCAERFFAKKRPRFIPRHSKPPKLPTMSTNLAINREAL